MRRKLLFGFRLHLLRLRPIVKGRLSSLVKVFTMIFRKTTAPASGHREVQALGRLGASRMRVEFFVQSSVSGAHAGGYFRAGSRFRSSVRL